MKADASLFEKAFYRASYLIISIVVLFLDQWSKGVVTRSFGVHDSREVLGEFFQLTYVRNSGAAFGLFASFESPIKSVLLNSIAVGAFIAVTLYAYRSHFKSVRLQIALALIVGGAVGNLIDRVRFGYVVDFLLFGVGGHYWPAFNIADSAICVGVGLLALDMLFSSPAPRDPAVSG
jgi:signal peptidase II